MDSKCLTIGREPSETPVLRSFYGVANRDIPSFIGKAKNHCALSGRRGVEFN
jgi:hypothetical protein